MNGFRIILFLWVVVFWIGQWFIYAFTPFRTAANEQSNWFAGFWAIVLALMIAWRLINSDRHT